MLFEMGQTVWICNKLNPYHGKEGKVLYYSAQYAVRVCMAENKVHITFYENELQGSTLEDDAVNARISATLKQDAFDLKVAQALGMEVFKGAGAFEVANRIEEARNVDHPKHYTQGGIECIDAIQSALTPDEFVGFLKGNIFKYIWRERNKGGAESCKKARWYLDRLLNTTK